MEITVSHKKALLLGATGLVGGFVLEELLRHEAYTEVHVLVRRSMHREHPKLTEHVIDFDKLTQYAALFSVHDVFCCLGTTMAKAGGREAFYKVDYTYIVTAAQLAAQGGANQFLVISSVGADPDSLFYYSRVKGETEMALRRLDFWALRIFRPSVLLGERSESRWAEELAGRLIKGIDWLTGGALSRLRPVQAETVAQAMVHAAQSLTGGEQVYGSEQLPALAGGAE